MLKVSCILLSVFAVSCSSVPDPVSDCEKGDFLYKGRVIDLARYGIGASVRFLDGNYLLVDIVPGGPVSKSKTIENGDRIILISTNNDGNYKDVQSMGLEDVVNDIRGCQYAELSLRLKREQEIFDVTLLRDQVTL